MSESERYKNQLRKLCANKLRAELERAQRLRATDRRPDWNEVEAEIRAIAQERGIEL